MADSKISLGLDALQPAQAPTTQGLSAGLDTLKPATKSTGLAAGLDQLSAPKATNVFADVDVDALPEAQVIEQTEEEAAFDAFKRDRTIEENKPFKQKAKEFGTGALRVIKAAPGKVQEFATEVGRVGEEDPRLLARSLIEASAQGGTETLKFGLDVAGSIADLFVDEEEEVKREFKRHREDQEMATAFATEGQIFDPSDVNQTIVAGGSLLLDPANFIGVGALSKAGKGLKIAGRVGKGTTLGASLTKSGKALEKIAQRTELPNQVIRRGIRAGAKTTAAATGIGLKFVEKTAKATSAVAGAPRKAFVGILTKMGVPSRFANASFLAGGAIPGGKGVVGGLVGAEIAGAATSKAAKTVSDISLVLSKPSTQIRFLERIAMSDDVPKSIKRLAAIGGARGTQKALDMAFDAIGDGVTAGTIQAALTFAVKDLTAEQLGESFGTGFALGAPLGAALGPRGAGIDPRAREDASIRRFMETKADKFQKEQISTLPRESQLLLGSLADGGFRSDIEVLNRDTYNTLLSKELADGGIAIDESVAPAIFTTSDGTIFVNGDARNKNNITSALTHEMGERLAKGILTDDVSRGGDPNLQASLKNSLVDNEKGFTVNLPGEGDIKLNRDAALFAKRYNEQNLDSPIMDTNDLVHKMVSEDVANIVTDRDFKIDGLAAKTPQSKQALFRVLDTMFERMGLVHPETGNTLKRINGLGKSAVIKRALRNHLALRKDLEIGIADTRAKRPDFVLERGKTHQQKVQELDPQAEVVTVSDIDPNVKTPGAVTRSFYSGRELDTNSLGRETGIGRDNNGQWVDPLLLDNLQINKKGRMIITDFTKSIRDFNKVKVWRKKKDKLSADLEVVPYAFQINQQGGLSLRAWDQRKLLQQVERLIDTKPDIGSVGDVIGRIQDARIRQSQGQRINDDLVSALLGARPELIKDPAFKQIAADARKGRKGIFTTIPIKDIAGFRDLQEPGLAVRIKDLLTTPE